MKDKTTAGVLALVLGGLGGHKFYLDRPIQGILYLAFCWTFIPGLLGIIEGIMLLTMPSEAFDARYNYNYLPGNIHQHMMLPSQAASPNQNIVVNVATAGEKVSVAEELKTLHELKLSGVLTEEEFQEQKRKLLANS